MNDERQILWDHQHDDIRDHALEPSWFRLWDPRTGKTRASVYEMGIWFTRGIRRVLIIAPMDGCEVWLKDDELGIFKPEMVRIVNLSTDASIKERAAEIYGLKAETKPTIVVVNRDVIFKQRSRKDGTKLTGLQQALVEWKPEAGYLDESHDFRRIGSQRARAAETIFRGMKFRRGLTGTPDPRDYIDFYAQYKIIAPHVFGTRKDDFIDKYCEMEYLYPNKVKRYKNVEELREKIFSVASRVKQEDCFDMPEILADITVDVPFNRLARELYTELTENLCAEFLGLNIDATHQLAKLTVLHQLAAGFVRDETGAPEWIFDGKIKATHDYVEEMLRADKRLVIYHKYTPEGQRLIDELTDRYGSVVVGSVNGATPRSQRSPHPFADRPAMRVFIAQEDTAQVSISLREADHVLWYSWGPKSEVNYQARQRIFDERSKKPHGLSYTFLRVPNTADDFMTAAVATKRAASELLLDYGFRQAAFGGATNGQTTQRRAKSAPSRRAALASRQDPF